MKINRILTCFTGTLFLSSVAVGINAQTKLTNSSKVYINGIGSVRVGMTVAEASKAAGTKLVGEASPDTSGCFYVQPQGEPKNMTFMVTDNRISTVDVFPKNKSITTLSGAKIGDTEAKIKSLYPEQIQVTPHKYVQGGHYLTVVPKDASNKNYRIVFETDGKKVTRFRSGKLPEVEYVEGCS